MTKQSKKHGPARMVLNHYIRETWLYRKWALPAMLLPGIGTVLIAYIPPLVIASVLADFGGNLPTELKQLLPYFLALGGSWILGEVLWHISFLFAADYQSKVIQRLSIYALDELIRRDSAFFNDNFTGSLTKRATAFSSNYERFLDTLTYQVGARLLPLIFAVIILWGISFYLVLALLALIVLVIFMIWPFLKRRQKLVVAREAAGTRVSGHVADVISNMATVQSFAHEQFEQKQHATYADKFTVALKNAWNYDTKRVHRIVFPMNVVTNLIGLILAVLVTDSAAGMATVFVVFSYFSNVTRLMFDFNSIYRNLESTISAAAEFTILLQNEPEVVDAPNATAIKVRQGMIELKDVVFAYPDAKDQLIFNGLNLTINSGQKIALVGRSGGGKTSITKMLLRLVDVLDGQVLIDGQDIKQHTLKSLRRSIAYVPQDPAMFHRTIMDNIRYGDLKASDEAVKEAARKAHALEFIEKLPQGFDTLVGERGVKLSGGQRQRVAIARAILKDAPILILDEATSALDSESEKLIQNSLDQLMQNRTSIVIAHRLSTISKLDRIIVLDNGEVIEDGTHNELLKQSKIYAKLWNHQSGGFIETGNDEHGSK